MVKSITLKLGYLPCVLFLAIENSVLSYVDLVDRKIILCRAETSDSYQCTISAPKGALVSSAADCQRQVKLYTTVATVSEGYGGVKYYSKNPYPLKNCIIPNEATVGAQEAPSCSLALAVAEL